MLPIRGRSPLRLPHFFDVVLRFHPFHPLSARAERALYALFGSMADTTSLLRPEGSILALQRAQCVATGPYKGRPPQDMGKQALLDERFRALTLTGKGVDERERKHALCISLRDSVMEHV